MLFKFLRFILNSLLCIFMAITICFIQIGFFSLVAAQSKKIDAVKLVGISDSQKVTLWDAFGFWGTDMSTGMKSDAKYRIRNWFPSWNGWQKGMGWADKALDCTIAFIKPIFVPIAQINALSEYHGRDISYFLNDDLEKSYKEYIFKSSGEKLDSKQVMERQIYELFVMYAPSLITENGMLTETQKIELFEKYVKNYNPETSIDGKIYSINSGEELDNCIGISYEEFALRSDNINTTGYMKWVDKNSDLYNHIWKLEKYNNPAYNIYFSKFIDVAADGTRSINTTVVVLYIFIFISIILAIIFVILYPVSLIQAKITGNKKRPDYIAS